MITFRLQCPKCGRKCVLCPDGLDNPQDNSIPEELAVHCYFCGHSWELSMHQTRDFITGLNLRKVDK
jgi:phage terminase large subunit GpA-like protein